MFRIGAFSKLTQVSVRMLRYYDESGLLKPEQVDEATGYRLYSARQIPQLRRILFLRDTGFGVAEMGEALRCWDNAGITHWLAEKKRTVEREIEVLQRRAGKLDLAMRDIAEENIAVYCNVAIKRVPGCLVLSLRRVIPDYYAEGALWKELAAFAERRRIAVSGQTFSIYHDADYRETDVDVELCAPVEALGENREGFTFRRTETIPLMASAMVYGPFERIAGAFLSFADWLGRHNEYEMDGPSRQIVHRGPWNEPDRDAWLTEMQIPLRERHPPLDSDTV